MYKGKSQRTRKSTSYRNTKTNHKISQGSVENHINYLLHTNKIVLTTQLAKRMAYMLKFSPNSVASSSKCTWSRSGKTSVGTCNVLGTNNGSAFTTHDSFK